MLKEIAVGAAGALVATLAIFMISQLTDWFTTYAAPDVPNRAVVSFELESCPEELGWFAYTQAQGKFIHDHNPEGDRKLGSEQGDSIRRHHHVFLGGGAAGTTNADNGDDRQNLWHGGDWGQGEQRQTSTEGDEETRPANIALLFCVKRGT